MRSVDVCYKRTRRYFWSFVAAIVSPEDFIHNGLMISRISRAANPGMCPGFRRAGIGVQR
jgi:hypothetical protein